MRPTVRLLAALCLGLIALPATAQECGTPQGRCDTGLGFYRMALPEDAAGPVPAMIYLHGWGGSSAGVMNNKAMRQRLSDRGYALIAPEGVARRDHGNGNSDWSVQDGGQHPRDDIAFIAEVLEDAAGRGIDRSKVLLAGFSRGGSMVWDVACHAPDTARAYAPVSGAFWEPLPERCAGPVALFHVHGWTDRVVPLEGRSLADGQLIQGDVFASLAILRRTNGCDARQPDSAPMEEAGIWLRRWTGCDGGRLDLMLHPGGHGIPPGWLARTLDWFEALEGEG